MTPSAMRSVQESRKAPARVVRLVFRATAPSSMSQALARINRMQNKDFLKNDALLGIAHTGKIDVNFFKAIALYNSAATVEVMTHPGFVDGLDADKTRLLHQRKVELDAICSEKTKQYLINQKNKPLTLEEAIIEINKKLQTEEMVLEFIKNLPMNDGPPCLQSIYLKGKTDYRNNYLFSLAGYYKAKHGDDFEFKLASANNELIESLGLEELNKTVISAHKRKDYSYKCNEEPICSICSKQECKKRKYGN